MNPIVNKNAKLMIGGVSAEDLIAEYGSPLYVYDLQFVRQQYETLHSAISYEPKRIHYAMKANSNPHILSALAKEGAYIDAVSIGEVEIAIKRGFGPEKILFTGVNLSAPEMERAMALGARLNIGSLMNLEKYGQNHPGSDISIRVNPAFGDGHHSHVNTGGPESKFGIFEQDFDQAMALMRKYDLHLVGIQCHIGSGILSVNSYRRMMDIILKLAGKFDGLEFVDFGGGIGVAYRPDEDDFDLSALGETMTEEMRRFNQQYGNELALAIEPGRFLVAESGYLLLSVRDIKSTSKYRFVGVDSGFNHLRRPMTYGSYHHIVNASNLDGQPEEVVVAGYICESGDMFSRDEEGPVPQSIAECRDGDVLAILNAGAYGYAMSSNYNSQLRPAEVIVDNGESYLSRRRETIDDLTRNWVDSSQ